MIGVLMVTWLALAVLTAWGFHLLRRHYIAVGEARDRHPTGREPMPSSIYDWDETA